MIRAYLIDDEPHALNILEILLQEADVTVVGKQDDPYRALEQIGELRPDVVFLDIEMPGISGLEAAERIQAQYEEIYIVYVTAFNEHAVKAFEQHALDYVLKPLEEERLWKTVKRIRAELHKNERNVGPGKKTGFNIYLFDRFEVFVQPDLEMKWRTSKARELFGLLILHADRGLYRDEIIELLWADEDYNKSKTYLHACVSFIRKSLQSMGLDDSLNFSNGKYCLAEESLISDYSWMAKALPHAQQWIKDGQTGQVEHLLSVYRGPLFADCDYPWARNEAERIHRMVGQLRFALVQYYWSRGDFDQAAATAEPLLEDYCSEEVVLMLHQIYSVLGRPAEAERVRQWMRESSV